MSLQEYLNYSINISTSANIILTNCTIPNIVNTNTSTSSLNVSSSLNANAATITNLFFTNGLVNSLSSTNITTTNLVSNFTSLGNLTSSTGTFANKVGGSQTVGTIVVTTSASLIGNTNTIGNLFTTGGNVGINITSPAFTLDVGGSTRVNSSQGIILSGGAANTRVDFTYMIPSTYLGIAASARIQSVDNNYSADLLFQNRNQGTDNTTMNTRMTIAAGGNVGINTISPGFNLDVNGSGRFTGNINLSGGSLIPINNITPIITYNGNVVNLFQNTAAAGSNVELQFGQSQSTNNNAILDFNYTASGSTTNSFGLGFFNGNNKLVVQAGGNVGIGTSSPAFSLDVAGSGRFNNSLLATFNSNTLGNLYTTSGNVGIGTVSPSAYSLLTINGGNSGAPFNVTQASIAFSYAPIPGFYHFIGSRHNATVGSNQNSIDFYLNNSSTQTGSSAPNFGNVNSMSVTATGVGIFNSNPSTTLDVNGNIRINFSSSTISNRITTSASDNLIYSSNTVGNYSLMWAFDTGATNSAPMCYLSAYGGQRFFTSALPRMLIDGNGNVGINTTSPANTLDVNGTSRIAGALNLNSGFTVNSNTASSVLNFSPLYIASDTNHYIRFANATNFNFANLGLDGPVVAGYSNVCLGTTGVGGQKAALIVNNSQQVGIGGISPAYQLDVNGTIRSQTGSGNIILQSPNDTNIQYFQGNQTANYWIAGAQNISNRFQIYNQSGIGQYMANGSNTWSTMSDIRLKKNIEKINQKDSLYKIVNLNPVFYNYKKDKANTPSRCGFIAQEVNEFIPSIVSKDIKDIKDNFLGISMTDMIPFIVNSIKELKAENDRLKNFINKKFYNELNF